ncbi:hypothetical protein [Alkaliphilus peptidifermentans]|uniref:Ferrochelatase n=1 Tax=Alkaliphilus peptidifermentans DSM 18978 TaxID=1120976 RepID=A0A1G5BG62_9FIRM|nr:hypothetical protein [Alkaliphilus peptidifermentans]SCX89163.1 hypothetical protein SAMN03080606_00408 [Alkaliphilus peptidifermentans DSM 18978]
MILMLKAIIFSVVISYGLITIGLVERFLWILAVLLGCIFFKNENIIKKSKINKVTLGIILGYFLTIVSLYLIQYKISSDYIAKNYLLNEKTAVILVFKGEPPTYDLPTILKNEFDYLSKYQYLNLPFRLFKTKLTYEKVSSISDSYYYTELKHLLQNEFTEEFKFYSSFINTRPYFEEVLNQAMVDGNGRIIISTVMLTDSNDFKKINEVVQRVNPIQHMRVVKNTNPLWDSDELSRGCVNWLNGYIEEDQRSNVGILILGEKYQAGLEEKNYIKQELLFREKVKDMLVQEGYNSRHVQHTFLDKRLVRNELEKLMNHAVKDIYIFQGTSLFEDINYKIEIEKILEGIDKPRGVEVHYITGWQLQDGVFNELNKRIKLLNMQR